MGVSSVCAAAFGRHSQPLKNLLGIGHQQTRSISRTNCVTASKRDYYAELRVARTATQEEIKTAFYDLSKMYHPDTATAEPEVAAQKFVQVAEAYEVLGNAKARKTYDMGEWIALNVIRATTKMVGIFFLLIKNPWKSSCRWVNFGQFGSIWVILGQFESIWVNSSVRSQ